MECPCDVCSALSRLRPQDATMETAAQLPESVRRVLAAQQRMRLGVPKVGDWELVQEAARRCRGGRFAPTTMVH